MELRDLLVLSPGDPVPDGVVDTGASPPVTRVDELLAAGHGVLVCLDTPAGTPPDLPPQDMSPEASREADQAALLAAVSVYAWLGVQVFRVPAEHVTAVRQALDMVASIKGTRPPTLSRRGLA